jgi:hypothetical protein
MVAVRIPPAVPWSTSTAGLCISPVLVRNEHERSNGRNPSYVCKDHSATSSPVTAAGVGSAAGVGGWAGLAGALVGALAGAWVGGAAGVAGAGVGCTTAGAWVGRSDWAGGLLVGPQAASTSVRQSAASAIWPSLWVTCCIIVIPRRINMRIWFARTRYILLLTLGNSMTGA